MDALILAAGLGSRLREVEPCKPLTRLHGISLLELSVQQLANVGASNIVVATGYKADAIEANLPRISHSAGVPVEARRVPDYHQPNGHSVLAGAAEFTGEFLLVMADHVFSLPVLEALVQGPPANGGVVLAVDRHTSGPLIDPDDATWVELDEAGAIRAIGKHLTHRHAVDCGAFRASPALLTAITAAIGEGKPGSLSDGMQRLADTGQARTVDIGAAWWIDVDDARMLELAQQQVRDHVPGIPAGTFA